MKDTTPRVAMVLPTYLPESFGGAEQQTRKLARALSELGVQITILAPRLKRGTPRREKDGDVSIVRFPLRRAPNLGGRHSLSFLSWCLQIGFWLVRSRRAYDVIHIVHGRLHALPAVLAGRWLRKPVIVKLGRGGDHFDLISVRSKFLYGPSFARLIAHHTTTWIANSAEIATDLKTAGIVPEQIFEIPNGVELPELPSRQWRSERRFLYLGRFDSEKALDHMIWGFAALPAGASASLTLAGRGACEDELKTLVSEFGLDSRVVFLPPVADIAPLFGAADFFLSTSLSEGQSNAMLEAMAFAVPPVVSRVSGTADTVTDGTSGITFPAGDDIAYLAALKRALSMNEDDYRAMAAAARATAEAKFAMGTVATLYLDIYRRINASPMERRYAP
jgi:glycosyltransferase involved in cell wall biosynthesis